MASRGRSVSRGKKVNSTFWVFCEGQTEESYVKALRAKYRLPIEVKPKVVGLSISEDLIKNHIDRNNHHEKDTNLYSNPSSSVYILIEELNKVKAEK